MARPTVNILFNISSNDVACTNPSGDTNWVKLDTGDYIAWRDSQQTGGDSLGGASYPVVIPESGISEAPKLFLMDYSESEYRQVILAGTEDSDSGGNYQHVCAAWFSNVTVTIPYLEAYDDNAHESNISAPLGAGTPANSIFKAICTTNGLPGADDWEGVAISGSDSNLGLDTAPIGAAGYVYWNMKMMLSDAMLLWDTADWYSIDLVFAIHFTYS